MRLGAVLSVFLLLVSIGSYRLGQSKAGFRVSSVKVDRSQPASKSRIDLNLFWQVWDKLQSMYLIKEDLDAQKMVWGAIQGMTASLGDPYTVFLPPKENKTTQENLNGSFEGVGIQLGYIKETLAVIAPLSGMPAEAVGVRAGDLILAIKDEAKDIDTDTMGMSLDEAVEIIRGEKDTPVILTLLHEGETTPIDIKIVRGTIVVKSVELKWLEDGNIAYIHLSRFGGLTESEWAEAVAEVRAKSNTKGLVLDLRNNPGGYLQGAIRYASDFLEKGLVVVKQEDVRGKVETYSVSRSGELLDIPTVVLVNKGSASSSEILAGALQDHGRAKIVGTRTFGKGIIQEAIDLGGGAGLHVTTAKWLTPNGTWIKQDTGLTPDVEVEFNSESETDEQLEKAVEILVQ